MSIKILQITAAYKPAYIYGGPTMSVAKLCETLITNKEQGATNKDKFELEVFTTTANGKTELDVTSDETTIVDGVKVTYFKRLTKDHTHFSPALLWALRNEILNHSRKQKAESRKQRTSIVHGVPFEETTKTNNSLSFGEGWGEEKLIIHIHAWWNLVSILSCAVAKWYHVPVILTPRGMLTAYTTTNRNSIAKTIIHKVLGKSLLKYCHIHATSEKEKHDVLSIIRPESISVIPNLVELGEGIRSKPACRTGREQRTRIKVQSHESKVMSPESNQLPETNDNQSVQSNNLCNQPRSEQQRHFKLIFLSRIEEKKGLDLLFEALTNLPFEWKLTIAGSGEETYVESLKTKAESLKINERINWVGHIKNEDKFKLLAEHDLMVLTSYNENFANVVIESLSVGTAVLLSNEVGLADYVEEKKLGWISDSTPENIKKNIIRAFKSVDSRILIREKAPQIITEDFDSKNLIKKYFTLYLELIHGRL